MITMHFKIIMSLLTPACVLLMGGGQPAQGGDGTIITEIIDETGDGMGSLFNGPIDIVGYSPPSASSVARFRRRTILQIP